MSVVQSPGSTRLLLSPGTWPLDNARPWRLGREKIQQFTAILRSHPGRRLVSCLFCRQALKYKAVILAEDLCTKIGAHTQTMFVQHLKTSPARQNNVRPGQHLTPPFLLHPFSLCTLCPTLPSLPHPLLTRPPCPTLNPCPISHLLTPPPR